MLTQTKFKRIILGKDHKLLCFSLPHVVNRDNTNWQSVDKINCQSVCTVIRWNWYQWKRTSTLFKRLDDNMPNLTFVTRRMCSRRSHKDTWLWEPLGYTCRLLADRHHKQNRQAHRQDCKTGHDRKLMLMKRVTNTQIITQNCLHYKHSWVCWV